MSGRAGGRLGYGANADNVGPNELNDVYSFGQFWVPAGAITPTEGFPFVIENYTSSGGPSLHYTWTVANMINGAKSGGTFTWAFKSDFVGAPDANIKLRMAPIFFSKVAGVAPADTVEWSLGAVNIVMGDNINFIDNSETELLSTVGSAFELNGGDQVSKQNVPLATINSNGVIGTPISSSDWNFLTMNIERDVADGDDDFPNPIFLYGVGVQFAVDFNNLAEWPD